MWYITMLTEMPWWVCSLLFTYNWYFIIILDIFINILHVFSPHRLTDGLYVQITSQKKKTGVIAPKRFVQRVKKENEIFRSYMHQVINADPVPFGYYTCTQMHLDKACVRIHAQFCNVVVLCIGRLSLQHVVVENQLPFLIVCMIMTDPSSRLLLLACAMN